jgi:hypothetical protein
MGHLSVPWAVGGGAVNDEVLARKLTYTQFGGGEGVTYSSACQVKPLAVPDSYVRASPGDYVIRARGVGQVREAYFGSIESDDVVPITPTGGVARSDLVIARIEDAHVAGEPWEVEDPAVGPYAFTRILSNVPSTTTNVRQLGNNFSAITLARIDIPAFTGAITAPMIKDFRSTITPFGSAPPPGQVPGEGEEFYHETSQFWTDTVIPPDGTNDLFPNTATPGWGVPGPWTTWPLAANWLVPIPWWATGVSCFVAINGIGFDEDVWGQYRMNLDNGLVVSREQGYDINYHGGPGTEQTIFVLADTVPIPSSIRGLSKRFKVETRRLNGAPTHMGRLLCFAGTSIYVQLNFKQFPSYD